MRQLLLVLLGRIRRGAPHVLGSGLGTGRVSVPPVLTFVHRADVPKAPETLTRSVLQQQQAWRTSMAALETQLGIVQRELAESIAATKGEADARAAMQTALSSFSEDLAAVRKFLLQTAQLGWLNHELSIENASGIGKVATASQELSASSARLEETMRQLANSLAGQLKELANRLDTVHHGGTPRRWLRTLMACLLLSLIAVPDGLAGEWENMRESYDNKLRAHAKRIAEIEARERGVPANQEKRADKITRDRITGITASRKGGGKARSLADTAEKASGGARALIDVYREQGEYLDIVMSEWRAEGAERRELRESIATISKNLERANANLARTIEVAETTTLRVPQSGVLEKVARSEAEAKERARWQHERAARERERQQREREAAERERGVW